MTPSMRNLQLLIETKEDILARISREIREDLAPGTVLQLVRSLPQPKVEQLRAHDKAHLRLCAELYDTLKLIDATEQSNDTRIRVG